MTVSLAFRNFYSNFAIIIQKLFLKSDPVVGGDTHLTRFVYVEFEAKTKKKKKNLCDPVEYFTILF